MNTLPWPRDAAAKGLGKAYCETDAWAFDPRHTGGVCPICGWRPEAAAARAKPAWVTKLRGVPWDIVCLAALVVVLVALGLVVARAAGI
jgi:hypothetical protein